MPKSQFSKSKVSLTAIIAVAGFFTVMNLVPHQSAEAAGSYSWIGPNGDPATPPSGWTSSVPLIATADVAAGQKKAQACGACHTLDKDGGTKVGPNLWGIVNRPHAHASGFSYSDAIKGMNMRPWSYEEIDSFLFDPQAHAPGTRMPFAGVKDTQERANVIAYLRTLADKPAALPKAK